MANFEKQKKKEQPKDNGLNLTREQYDQIVRANIINKINQFLRGMGTVFVAIVYFLMAEFLWETSWFGAIFPGSRDEYNAFWKFIGTAGEEIIVFKDGVVLPEGAELMIPMFQGKIFDDWFKWGAWIPQACMTVFLILLTIGIGYIIAFSINDIVGMIKNLLVNSRKTIADIGKTATDNVSKGLGLNTDEVREITKPKKLLDDDLPVELSKAKKKKEKVKEESTEFDKMLNELLTSPHTADEEKIVEEFNKTSLNDLINQARVDE